MAALLAPRLTPGDTIGVFSPSAPATAWVERRTALAEDFLTAMGFHVKHGTLWGRGAGYRSGSIRERAAELNALIHDPDVNCVMAAGGGLVSNSLLPYIDYEAVCRHPKLFVGFSDVTAILLAILARTGLVTFYGPNLIATLGEIPPWSEESFAYFLDVVQGGWTVPHELPVPPRWTEDSVGLEEIGFECEAHDNRLVTVRGGCASGRLIGGNLDTISGFFGTPYMPDIRDGDILFIEDCKDDPERIERAFSLLKCAGVFEKISGLIMGKHADYRDRGTGLLPWDAALEIIGAYDFPVLAEFDCGHTKPMLTVPLGGVVRLDAGSQRVALMSAVTL